MSSVELSVSLSFKNPERLTLCDLCFSDCGLCFLNFLDASDTQRKLYGFSEFTGSTNYFLRNSITNHVSKTAK